MTRRPILVVVPVYGARAELRRCVEALVATVDTALDSVLFVNDCGPSADEIEADLLAVVNGRRGFTYARNPRNLGFVGTCNRAAAELAPPAHDILFLNSDAVPTPGWLDELAQALEASPEHGIACPRSDNATIASLPFRRRDPARERTPERTLAVHTALKDRLPPFSVVPVAMGFCFLVRRELIEAFGLFDEVFSPGYGEENDFCLRMRQRGFLSVMAHRALVFHQAGQSFPPPQRVKLRARHELVLRRRHPEYGALLHRYLHAGADALDVFADVVAPRAEDLVRIVVAGSRGTPAPDGVAISFLGGRGPGAVPAAVGSRVWDLAIAVGEVGERELAVLRSSAPRLLLVPALTPEVLDDAVAAARRPLDDDAVREAWHEAGSTLDRAGLLIPPRPSLRSRALGLLDRWMPRVGTRVRQLLAR